MKILLVADTYYPDVNGASYFAQRLAKNLARRGNAVEVIAPSRGFYHEEYSRDGVSVIGVRSVPILIHKEFRTVLPFGNKRLLRKQIKRFSPDVVHFQSHFVLNRTVAAVAREFHIPQIGTNHFMPDNLVHYIPAPQSVRRLISNLAWRDFCNVFKRFDMVTTPTATAAQKLDEIGFQGQVVPVSCGIDLARFHPVSSREDARALFGIRSQAVVFTFVGRLDKEKNVDLLLEAFTKVDDHAQFLIAGKGFEADRLRERAAQLGLGERITFLGFVSDEKLPMLYQAADVFVIAGTAELQSIATMEAMASGLPVIAVDAVALPELVHHKKNGYLFADGNVTMVAKYMNELAKDAKLRDSMGAESLRIIQKHAIGETLLAYESLYGRVAKTARFQSNFSPSLRQGWGDPRVRGLLARYRQVRRRFASW